MAMARSRISATVASTNSDIPTSSGTPDKSGTASRVRKPILSADVLKECKRLKVRSIPAKCNNKTYLAHHFKVYRNLKSIVCNPIDGTAIVEYTSHESAVKAKRSALNFRPGTAPVKIDWIVPKAAVENIPEITPPLSATSSPGKQLSTPGITAPILAKSKTTPTVTPQSGKKQSPLLKKVLKRQFREKRRQSSKDYKSAEKVGANGGKHRSKAVKKIEGEISDSPPNESAAASDFVDQNRSKQQIMYPGVPSGAVQHTSSHSSKAGASKMVDDESPSMEYDQKNMARDHHDVMLPDHQDEAGSGDFMTESPDAGEFGAEDSYFERLDPDDNRGVNDFGDDSFKELVPPMAVDLAHQLSPARVSKRRLTKSQQDTMNALMALVKQTAHSVEERKNILEERDRIMRKAKGFMKMGVGLGTCPDMCPEKERYVRSYQRLVDSYEMTENKTAINPYRAVKDYSRSSADQEQPLSHELRPGPVLARTMAYLLREIVGVAGPASTASLSGWFDFLWKRTRSIRKDLTQQKICDRTAVELFEKCTRFHIFAGYWMCELDKKDFDQTINTENLSKCLQSLRHLYEDLSKRGVVCPNEAEFRSYQILLNMEDSNVLVQALSWSQYVRQSVEVKTTIKCLNALQARNCVRFFRIVEQKFSFLQACMAHRYFGTTRALALEAMSRAYTTPPFVPTDYLCRILAFDSESELVEFCAAHEISEGTKDYKSIIYLNNKAFQFPNVAPKLKKCEILIETKVKCPLFEILNGGKLEEFSSYCPVDSFDEAGRFNCDPVTQQFLEDLLHIAESTEHMEDAVETGNSDSETEEVDNKPATPESFHLSTTFSPRVTAENKLEEFALLTNMTLMKEVCEEEISEEVVSACAEVYCDHLIDSFVTSRARSTAQSQYEDSLAKLAKLNSQTSEGLERMLNFCLPGLIRDEAKNVLRIEWQRSIDQFASTTGDQLIRETVDQLTADIVEEFHEANVSSVLQQLGAIRQRLVDAKTRTVLRFWREKACRQYRQRMLVRSFPAAPSISPKQLLGSSRKRSLPPGISAVSPEKIKRAMECLKEEQEALQARHREAWTQIDWKGTDLSGLLASNPVGCLIRDGHRNYCILRIAVVVERPVAQEDWSMAAWVRTKLGFQKDQDVCHHRLSITHNTELIVVCRWFLFPERSSSRFRPLVADLTYYHAVVLLESSGLPANEIVQALYGFGDGQAGCPVLLVTNSELDRTEELECRPLCSYAAQVALNDEDLDDLANGRMFLAGLCNILPHCRRNDVTVVEARALLSDSLVLLQCASPIKTSTKLHNTNEQRIDDEGSYCANLQLYRNAFDAILTICDENIKHIDLLLTDTGIRFGVCSNEEFAGCIRAVSNQLSLIGNLNESKEGFSTIVNNCILAMPKNCAVYLNSTTLTEVEDALVQLTTSHCIDQSDMRISTAADDEDSEHDDDDAGSDGNKPNDGLGECRDLLGLLNQSIVQEKTEWASEEAKWLMMLEDDLFS